MSGNNLDNNESIKKNIMKNVDNDNIIKEDYDYEFDFFTDKEDILLSKNLRDNDISKGPEGLLLSIF